MPAKKPNRFDANVIVIGGGSAGLISAYIATTIKAKVILVESGKMGGDCLNSGCVPSKALITAARRMHYAKNSARFGVSCGDAELDFRQAMTHVKGAIDAIAPNDSVDRFTRLGVHCIQGHAQLTDPWTVAVDNKSYKAKNLIIASGAEPAVPPIPGLDTADYLTSDNLWELTNLPPRLAIMGGGPIGCELAQCFARLGSNVSLIEMQPQLLASEDEEVGELLRRSLEHEGVSVYTGTTVNSVNGNRLHCSGTADNLEIEFDRLLVAAGRRPRIRGFGLEDIGVEIAKKGTIAVNPFLQTNYSHIYACGDVAGPYQFTHAASHQAWHASVNALFRPFKRFKIDYKFLPWAIFTDPEIARAGINERQAVSDKIAFETTVFPLQDLDRAITEGDTAGFIKIITPPNSDRILGATVVGAHAGELIGSLTLAMKHGLGLNKVLSTIFPYPTWSEALKRTSGVWKQNHAPAWIMPWLERFHRLTRGSS